MQSFAEFQRADRRLVLLRALLSAAQYRANHFLLGRFAETVGHTVSHDVLQADLAWLAEAGLMVLDRSGDVTVATLTQRGNDVANGRAEHPGVSRPAPGY